MDGMTNQILVDLFTNTPFVGFLIWQYVQMRKDIKEQQDKTDHLRVESLQREEEIRARFEKVIQALNEDKDQLISGLQQRLDEQSKRMDVLESSVKKLFSMMSKIKDYINNK
jgi:cell division protein FtsB